MSEKPVTVLLIEDNLGDARLVREMLIEGGPDRFDLTHAVRLEAGRQHLKETPFDVVLLDLFLPDSEGLETLTRIQGEMSSIPIVVLSGLSDEALAVQAVHQGAQDYLVKGQGDGHLLQRALCYAIERKSAAASLQKSEKQLAEAQCLAQSGSWQWDIRTDQVAWSDGLYRIFGLKKAKDEVNCETYSNYIHVDDRKKFKAMLKRTLRRQSRISHNHRIVRPDGTERILHMSGRILVDRAGEAVGMIGSSQDITEQKKGEATLRARGRQQAAVAGLGQLALAGTEIADLVNHAVSLIAKTLEIEYCEVLECLPQGKRFLLRAGVGWREGRVGSDLIGTDSAFAPGYALSSGRPIVVEDFETETRFKGHPLLVDHYVVSGVSLIIQGQGRPFGILGVYSAQRRSFVEDDIHFLQSMANVLAAAVVRRRAEEVVEHQAYHDALTGLPNRLLLEDRLAKAIAQAQRGRHAIGVVFLDLDRFKAVNDSLGHAAGDKLLQVVAQRLSQSIREVDTVARMGGDEFSILLTEVESLESATEVAERIFAALKPSINLEGHRLHVAASIGIALYSQAGQDAQTLLKNADTALYRAKDEGGNAFKVYSPAMRDKVKGGLETEFCLRLAIERGEFQLHFQPQFSLKSRELIGFEALIRWERPDTGLVPPMEFIPLAEDVGLLLPIGEWVLRAACEQNKIWQASGLPLTKVGVNLSPCQFGKGNFAALVNKVLVDTNLDPHFLELELTERLLMQNEERHIAILRELTELGVQLTIDDFGTGYSSLSYLKRLPLSKLKIDRTFVRDITTDTSNAVIAKTVISMAHSLHLKALAEGVETLDQLNFLETIQCDEVQGFFLSRPMTAEAATLLLAEDKGFSSDLINR